MIIEKLTVTPGTSFLPLFCELWIDDRSGGSWLVVRVARHKGQGKVRETQKRGQTCPECWQVGEGVQMSECPSRPRAGGRVASAAAQSGAGAAEAWGLRSIMPGQCGDEGGDMGGAGATLGMPGVASPVDVRHQGKARCSCDRGLWWRVRRRLEGPLDG